MIKIVSSFFIMMVIISAGSVYGLKETTEQLDAHKRQLSAMILQDRSAIKVLNAEMAYLAQPERLEKLSKRFLALSPFESYQMANSINTIAARENLELVSLPVDAFPLLLPQEKPESQEEKHNTQATLVSSPAENIQKLEPPKAAKPKAAKPKAVAMDFYTRISLKLEKGE